MSRHLSTIMAIRACRESMLTRHDEALIDDMGERVRRFVFESLESDADGRFEPDEAGRIASRVERLLRAEMIRRLA